MRTRADIEQWEDETLAPYAMHSREAGARVHPEPKHEMRTCFQRDRDRVVHCEAFRKLEYKTQVFAIFEGDYYRTRLTHTIEVAQMGRTIGRSLRLNEDLIEAIALAHDLGHPPFGHAGEEALNTLMSAAGERLGLPDLEFDHNQRSYEIVTHLEKRYPDFEGLNLTPEVLVGILKHQTLYDRQGHSETFLKEGPTLEARVVDFADSLAYLNHDIDDGLTSGFITEEDLMESVLWQRALEKIRGAVDFSDREMMKYQVVKQLIDMQIRDFLSATDERLRDLHFGSAQAFKDYDEHKEGIVVGFSEDMYARRKELQALLHAKLYRHYHVVRMTSKAKRVIEALFLAYGEEPEQLPYQIYDREKTFGSAKEKARYQYNVICHYIASMTDRAALEEHKRLYNPYTKV